MSDRRFAGLFPFPRRGAASRSALLERDEPAPEKRPSAVEESVIDAAIYRGGDRVASPAPLAAPRAQHAGAPPPPVAWVGVV
ncbi:MAG: transporter, partial [Actinomycetia bacterium]|nr:transporter [Actinomycetes bacterium]